MWHYTGYYESLEKDSRTYKIRDKEDAYQDHRPDRQEMSYHREEIARRETTVAGHKLALVKVRDTHTLTYVDRPGKPQSVDVREMWLFETVDPDGQKRIVRAELEEVGGVKYLTAYVGELKKDGKYFIPVFEALGAKRRRDYYWIKM